MSGDKSTGHNRLWRRRRSTIEEKIVGYGGEERRKTGKGAEREREQVPSFFFSFFLFLLDD